MAGGWSLSTAGAVVPDKASLRRRMRQMRLVADQKHGPEAALQVLHHGLDGLSRLGIGEGVGVAGYWPIATELDIRPLLARCHARGAVCALPVVAADDHLAFRRWSPETIVEEGPRGTWHPPATAESVEPEVVFVPLLAVDDRGVRLGQGGGYYDRTLARLRAGRPVTAIGVGYAVQRVTSLPADGFDQPMDWVLTEAGLERVAT
ncbi:MAG: 5-formyltetrahydrofolate cyclo-ligase [Rhodospirillales bacterium]